MFLFSYVFFIQHEYVKRNEKLDYEMGTCLLLLRNFFPDILYIYIYNIYICVCVYIYIYQSITRYKKRLQCCIVNKQILKILLLRRGKRILICKKFAFDYKCLTLTVQLDSFRMKHIYNEFWHSFLFIFSSIISFYLKVFSVVSIDVDIQ